MHSKEGKGMSLKVFVKSLIQSGNDETVALAKAWFANKKGAKNQDRKPENEDRIKLEKLAKKAAKKQQQKK